MNKKKGRRHQNQEINNMNRCMTNDKQHGNKLLIKKYLIGAINNRIFESFYLLL